MLELNQEDAPRAISERDLPDLAVDDSLFQTSGLQLVVVPVVGDFTDRLDFGIDWPFQRVDEKVLYERSFIGDVAKCSFESLSVGLLRHYLRPLFLVSIQLHPC